MSRLANPAESPCWGCGPRHPRGLHLAFDREGDEVQCTYTPKPDEIGWPGLFHTGLHFTVLFETSYWAALELGGRVMNPVGDVVYTPKRLPRTGAPFRVRARVASPGAHGPRISATSESLDGMLNATLVSEWRPASRARTEKAGITLPKYLLDDMEP